MAATFTDMAATAATNLVMAPSASSVSAKVGAAVASSAAVGGAAASSAPAPSQSMNATAMQGMAQWHADCELYPVFHTDSQP